MKNVRALKQDCLITYKMVYYQYHQKVYAFVAHKTSSAYLAEEVTQLTFIKLWEKRHQLSDEYNIDVQLFRIARNAMIDELRKDAVRNNLINQLEREINQPYIDNLGDRETLKNVNDAIEMLPPARKMIFKLSRFNNLTNAEIARMLSISTKTVENHITLAIKQLRKSAISTAFVFLLDALLNNC
ncbi:RNA polymerase sigma-70 factor [Mucilaginibacter sp. UR6-1]|uniref:RNA polymerase sigma-70 factor n=1 Tax=Mucilaginibacter sp. UR6-1 TaxID=1435643 RepID=UPI001E3AAB02|nr:RNA polymerase sigma-70 factor [Mucilaginibacter sp. UR6-1]MCC8409310.1 RNA polymerase sigma-70 factor [Mucilaginibacter sp. UR6-1]